MIETPLEDRLTEAKLRYENAYIHLVSVVVNTATQQERDRALHVFKEFSDYYYMLKYGVK